VNYTVYQITNIINDKIYIGMHQTLDIDDDYMGSSEVLRKAYKKYGIENFTKQILYTFDSEQDMLDKEAEIVNEDFVKRIDTYNIKEGGIGRWNHINDIPKEKRPNLIKIKKMKEQGLINWGGIQNRSEEGWRKVREQYWGSDTRKNCDDHLNYERMTDKEKKERNSKISRAIR